jgi:hypothetical protein
MGGMHCNGIEGLSCNLVIHGHEKATRYLELLDARRLSISLFHNFEHHVQGLIFVVDKKIAYSKSYNS